MKQTFLPAIFVVLLFSSNSAWAESACDFGVAPETSGFLLNPIIDKMTVTRAKPSAPGKTCSLMIGDQILELNQHAVPGTRALKVRGYFNEVKDGELYTLKVKRGDKIVLISTK
jgi:hypothetical protein